MLIKDTVSLGMSLPHRSPDGIPEAAVRQVAQRAEALGFADLWVTDNVIDPYGCLDSLTVLTYAAALTSTIRFGVSVLVIPFYHPLHVANRIGTLDQLSGGRAILGVGLGRADEYAAFGIPQERRVRRFRESIELIKALWAEPSVTYRGEIFQLEDVHLATRPVQRPHPPIWFGGHNPDMLRRAAELGDGWMGAGGSTIAGFAASLPPLRAALEQLDRDPATFPISKRVFVSVDERPEVAQAELHRWCAEVYHRPSLTTEGGIFGRPEQVREQLEQLASLGPSHLLLNPVGRYAEQLEALAEVVGFA